MGGRGGEHGGAPVHCGMGRFVVGSVTGFGVLDFVALPWAGELTGFGDGGVGAGIGLCVGVGDGAGCPDTVGTT